MIKTIIGAAAIAAVTLAIVPAQAAKMGVGCSSANLTKTETSVEAMADAILAAYHEIRGRRHG